MFRSGWNHIVGKSKKWVQELRDDNLDKHKGWEPLLSHVNVHEHSLDRSVIKIEGVG